MAEMVVTIRRGEVEIDVVGSQGPACEEITRSYENRLAEGPVNRHFKPEHEVGGEDHQVSEFG